MKTMFYYIQKANHLSKSISHKSLPVCVHRTGRFVFIILFFAVIGIVAHLEAAQIVSTTISVGNKPEGISVNSKANRIYVVNSDDNTISVIDGLTNKVTNTISVGKAPMRAGVNTETNRIYVSNSNDNTVSIINGSSNTTIATITAGGNPLGIAVNSLTNFIYAANVITSTLSVINGASTSTSNAIVNVVPIGRFPKGIGINPSTNTIYVANSGNDTVTVIDGNTNNVTATVSAGKFPNELGVNTSTNRIFTANFNDDNVSVIDGTTNKVIDIIGVGDSPQGVGVDSTRNLIYIANFEDDSVSVIDGATNKVIDNIPVGENPVAVGVNSVSNTVYVVNKISNNVMVIKKVDDITPSPTAVATVTPTAATTPTATPFTLPPIADFKTDLESGIMPLTVEFTDLSENSPDSWLWEFGDGIQSSQQNPIHIYENAGLFSVTLTVANNVGEDILTKQGFINVEPNEIVAEFTVEPFLGFAPLTAQFTDLSEPEESLSSWLWEFGDGVNSSEQNPKHEYKLEGFYTVKLTIKNSKGESIDNKKTNIIIVKPGGLPVADFAANTTTGAIPLDVTFTDLTESRENITSWIWDFGDEALSTEQSPTHTYRNSGIYTVTLTVNTSSGSDTITKTNLIGAKNTEEMPVVGFTVSSTIGKNPLKVNFTDNSLGDNIEKWLWDFGDNAMNTAKNPTHIYNKEGTFTVNLTVSTGSLVNTESKTNLIRVFNPKNPAAFFSANPHLGTHPFNVQFIDNSFGNLKSWDWDFGDGTKSTEQNPIHTYLTRGKFTVTLTVNDGKESDTFEQENLIKALPAEPDVDKPQPANLKVSFDPNPVPKSGRKRWNYKVFVEETNGAEVSITRFEAKSGDTVEQSGDGILFTQLFNSCGAQPDGLIAGFDTACADIQEKQDSETVKQWSFSGIDENGNNVEGRANITLSEKRR